MHRSCTKLWAAPTVGGGPSSGLHSETPHPCLTFVHLSSTSGVLRTLFNTGLNLQSMRLPFTPNHIQLVRACYPPSSALLSAGPNYCPNSQELSRLTYYASNRPGKLTKLGNELERRAKLEAQRAQTGNARARALLLITLAIFKALVAECRRDLSLLTRALISSVVAALSCFPRDLEVAARSASVVSCAEPYIHI